MLKETKKMLDEIDDFFIQELDGEIEEINTRIDKRIARNKSYSDLSKEHKKLVVLRKQILMGV